MPKRMASPVDPAAVPLLERVTIPLYDSVKLATALPTQPIQFFQVPLGQGEQGGSATAFATKNLLNTNLETQGHLPAPRLFSIQGVSMVMDQFSSALRTLNATNLFRTSEVLQDYIRIIHYSLFELTVGSKPYVQVPTFDIPANYGAEGGSIYDDATIGGEDPGGTTVAFMREAWSHTGRHHKLVPRAITIAPQQQFRVTLNFDTGGQALSVGGLNTAGDLLGDRRLWVVLHGEQGREVA